MAILTKNIGTSKTDNVTGRAGHDELIELETVRHLFSEEWYRRLQRMPPTQRQLNIRRLQKQRELTQKVGFEPVIKETVITEQWEYQKKIQEENFSKSSRETFKSARGQAQDIFPGTEE